MTSQSTERPKRYEIRNYKNKDHLRRYPWKETTCQPAKEVVAMLSIMSKGLAHNSAKEAVEEIDWDGLAIDQTVQVEAEHIYKVGLRAGEALRVTVYVTRIY